VKKIRLARLFLWTIVLLVVGFWALVGVALARDGWARISVESTGPSATSVHLAIPAATVEATLHAMALAGVRDLHLQADAARLLPLSERVVAALAAAPDADFVRVEAGEQHVVVEKRSSCFRIHVRTADGERVRVVVPTRAVRHILAAAVRMADDVR